MACVVENADTRFESPSVPYFQDAGHDSSGLPITGLADRQFAVALLFRSSNLASGTNRATARGGKHSGSVECRPERKENRSCDASSSYSRP